MWRTSGALGLIAGGATCAVLACSSGSDAGKGDTPVTPDPSGTNDAGGGDGSASGRDSAAPPGMTAVTTFSPPADLAASVKTNATWAAVREGEGTWRALAATSPGRYELATSQASWSMAFVCATAGDVSSAVSIVTRPSTTTSLDVVLDSECAAPPGAAHSVTGSLTNVPTTTSWLNFGYALSARGEAQPVAASTLSYEVVNVADGTWDFAFGLRNDSALPLTRIALRRAQTLSADETLDVDVGTVGVTPVAKSFVVHGVTSTESFTPAVAFVMGGFTGLDVGPQNVPTTTPDVTMSYDALPDAALVATDRYRIDIAASDDALHTTRGATGAFHSAVAVDVTLPDAFPAPVATVSTKTPYLLTTTQLAARPSAATYETSSEAVLSRNARHRWSVSVAASLFPAAPAIALPDLGGVTGFKPAWALPSTGDLTITGGAIEKPSSLSDGTLTRAATTSITLAP